MKRALLIFGIGLSLSGCAIPIWQETAPGAALPKGIYVCNHRDNLARCTDWSNKSDQCVNPKGPYEKDPLVMCSDMKTPVGNAND